MSGHSKWNNIKRKKEKTDGARAKVFTKIGREIAVAVKEGGGNPASNSKLAALIAKAKANSVPNDNIQRIIKRAEGGDKTEYEAITYEGYGPGGIAVMVETLTDNRNRTAANMRHYFDKFGGNLGQMGCVGFMFTQKGVIVVDLEDKDPDELMMDALDAGADDFDAGEDAAEVTTSPENFTAVCDALLLPAGQLARFVVNAVLQADPNQRPRAQRLALLFLHAAVDERKLHIFQRVQGGNKIESLKDKTDFPVADQGEFFIPESPGVLSAQQIGAAARNVQAAEDIHQRGFSGTGLPNNRHEFPRHDGQVDSPQRVDILIGQTIKFTEVV